MSRALLVVVVLGHLSGLNVTAQQAGITLPEVLQRVRTGDPRLGAAASRESAVRGMRRTMGAFPNPMLGILLENATLPGRTAVPGMDQETMATASVPLEFIYQRGARVRRGDALVEVARADAFAERQQLALHATRAYYRVALSQVQLAIALDLAMWLDSLVVYNQVRVAEGVVGESDLLRTQLERDRAWTEVTLHQAAAIAARAELATFHGDSTTNLARLTVALPDDPLVRAAAGPEPRAQPDAGPVRPELVMARARLTATTAGIDVAQANLVPDLSAMAGLKWSAGTTTLLAGFSMPLPLLSQNGGDRDQANAERDAAAFELAATERQVRAELLAAGEAARLLLDRVQVLKGSPDSVLYLARADETRRIALGAYREGAVPLLQVLDAARTWGDARVTWYRTLYAQHESVVALLVAEGRDLFVELGPGGSASMSKETPR